MTKEQFLAKWVQKEYRERKKGIGYGLKKQFSTEEVFELMEAWNTHASSKKPDFFCGHQVHGFERCESQCDCCKDKPKIQKA